MVCTVCIESSTATHAQHQHTQQLCNKADTLQIQRTLASFKSPCSIPTLCKYSMPATISSNNNIKRSCWCIIAGVYCFGCTCVVYRCVYMHVFVQIQMCTQCTPSSPHTPLPPQKPSPQQPYHIHTPSGCIVQHMLPQRLVQIPTITKLHHQPCFQLRTTLCGRGCGSSETTAV